LEYFCGQGKKNVEAKEGTKSRQKRMKKRRELENHLIEAKFKGKVFHNGPRMSESGQLPVLRLTDGEKRGESSLSYFLDGTRRPNLGVFQGKDPSTSVDHAVMCPICFQREKGGRKKKGLGTQLRNEKKGKTKKTQTPHQKPPTKAKTPRKNVRLLS